MSVLAINLKTPGATAAQTAEAVRSQAEGLVARAPKVAAETGARATRRHLYGLDRARHHWGQHFYGQAADATTGRWSGNRATVSIASQGMNLRFYGGTIRAGANGSGKTWLTIPAADEAQGKATGDFAPGYFRFIPLGDNLAALVPKAAPAPAKGAAPKLDVFYWLKREVTQAPDPTVLPAPDALEAEIKAGLQSDFDHRRT